MGLILGSENMRKLLRLIQCLAVITFLFMLAPVYAGMPTIYPDRTIGICPEIPVIQSAVILNVRFDNSYQKYIASGIVDAGYDGFVKRDWMLAIELNKDYTVAPSNKDVVNLLKTLNVKYFEKVIYEAGSPPECLYSGEGILVHAAIY